MCKQAFVEKWCCGAMYTVASACKCVCLPMRALAGTGGLRILLVQFCDV